MDSHIENGQDGVRIALPPIALDGSADKRLREDEVREVVDMERLCVALEELRSKPLEGEVIDVRVRIEKLEVDVHEALLARIPRRELIAPAKWGGGGGAPTRSLASSLSESSSGSGASDLRFAMGVEGEGRRKTQRRAQRDHVARRAPCVPPRPRPPPCAVYYIPRGLAPYRQRYKAVHPPDMH